jgi:hypothetical protein
MALSFPAVFSEALRRVLLCERMAANINDCPVSQYHGTQALPIAKRFMQLS